MSADLLNDAARRARMSEAGRTRMGAPGGARLDALLRRIVSLGNASALGER